MVAAVAGADKLVLVTFANHHFGDFARNWVSHVRGLGLGNYLVGAMDDRLLQVPPPRPPSTPGAELPASWHACLSMHWVDRRCPRGGPPAAGPTPPPSHRRRPPRIMARLPEHASGGQVLRPWLTAGCGSRPASRPSAGLFWLGRESAGASPPWQETRQVNRRSERCARTCTPQTSVVCAAEA
jgi:hypothetical protein